MAESPFNIELVDVLSALREQINAAQRSSVGQSIEFSLQEIELELAVSRAKKEEGKAGIDFKIFNAAIGSQTTNVQEKTIRIKLNARQITTTPEGSIHGRVLLSDDETEGDINPTRQRPETTSLVD